MEVSHKEPDRFFVFSVQPVDLYQVPGISCQEADRVVRFIAGDHGK